MTDGEEKLIKDAIRGEASAFGLLYDHYQPQIYRFIYLKVNHREEAEDLTHQVFLNAWQNIEKYNFRGFPFSSWLYRIARNKTIDYYRTKKENIDLTIITEEIISIDKNTDEIIDTVLNAEKVKKTIKQLKPSEQEVIILRFIEELSLNETAKIMGKTVTAVKLIQHRAIKNLHRLLEKELQIIK